MLKKFILKGLIVLSIHNTKMTLWKQNISKWKMKFKLYKSDIKKRRRKKNITAGGCFIFTMVGMQHKSKFLKYKMAS
jgi:hypothetical protein